MQILPEHLITDDFISTKKIQCNLKIVDESYETHRDLINLIKYPGSHSIDNLSHSIGCNVPSDSLPDPFESARELYGNDNGSLARHYIIGFKYAPNLVNPSTLPFIAYNIAMFFSPCYQVVYAFHESSKIRGMYHIHLVVSNTNIINGNRLPRNEEFKRLFCNHINSIRLGNHSLNVFYATNYV